MTEKEWWESLSKYTKSFFIGLLGAIGMTVFFTLASWVSFNGTSVSFVLVGVFCMVGSFARILKYYF